MLARLIFLAACLQGCSHKKIYLTAEVISFTKTAPPKKLKPKGSRQKVTLCDLDEDFSLNKVLRAAHKKSGEDYLYKATFALEAEGDDCYSLAYQI